jgi:hypothetical protein
MTAVVVESNDGTSAVSAVSTSERHDAGPGVSARSRAAGVIGESSTWIGALGQSEKAFGVNGKGLNDASGVGHAARDDHRGAEIGVFGPTVSRKAAVFGQTSAANGAVIRGQHDAGEARLFRISEVGPTGTLTLTTGAAFTRGNVLGDGGEIYNGLNGTLTVTGVTGCSLFITAKRRPGRRDLRRRHPRHRSQPDCRGPHPRAAAPECRRHLPPSGP